MSGDDASGAVVTIRRADIGDAEALARIGADLFEQTYAGAIPPDEMALHIAEDFGTDRQRAELSDPGVVSLLVEDQGVPAGFAQVRSRALPVSADEPANVELWRIYLDRRLQGRGVARRLLEEVGNIARAMGASGIWLSVWERNARAISFYSRHGFVPVGRQDFHVGGAVHCDMVLRASADAF